VSDQFSPGPALAQETTRLGIATKWWVLVSVGIGTFMSALDASVVNLILPVVRADFGVEVSTIEWVVTIYPLLISGLLLSFGRMGDLYGHRRIYLVGFVLFIASSVAAALAPSAGALVAARAVQALGGAMLQSNSPAILTTTFPGSQRGQALGLQGTMTYLGVMVGPPLGGWLATRFSWRAAFYINVPIGLLALTLAWLVIPRRTGESARERFDPLGAFTFLLGLSALLLAVNRGKDWGWASPGILGLLAGALAALTFFVIYESRIDAPMLDLSLFRRRIFSASAVSAVLNYMCVFGMIFLMPFFLIEGQELSPDRAGLLLIAQPLVMAIVAPISGTLSDRIGSRLLASLGMAGMGIGMFLLSRLGPTALPVQVIVALAVVGLGVGVFVSPNNNALMGAAPRRRQGVAAGVLATGRNLGATFGVAMSGAIFAAQFAALGGGDGSEATVRAVSAALLAMVGVAALGVVTSAVRGGAGQPA
jgi:EmrB/QacA subfamily drug resistance transporter